MFRYLTALFLLAGCAAVPARAEIRLAQADGEFLVLQGTAGRLVTLSPNLAELAYAAGAGDAVVATVEYSDFPAAAVTLPRVGDAFRLDIEAIVSLQPDLVVAWDSGTPRGAVEQLRDLGIPVWSVEIRSPREISSSLRDFGRATSNEASAATAAAAFDAGLERLVARFDSAEPLTYFYQVDANPLFTVNGDHLISQGLALCGGRNIFADEPGLAFQVAHEAVIVEDPDALFAPRLPGDADPLVRWREWPGMKAVQRGALFTLHADRISRASPRWLDSIETACTLLHDLRHKKM